MNADGSNRTQLTDNPRSDHYPTFSPDGSKIAFTSARDGGIPYIYVMNSDGTNQARLTATAASEHSPSWGIDIPDTDGDGVPDFRDNCRTASNPLKIAYRSAAADGSAQIFTMNADGTNRTQLTNLGDDPNSPTVSPDGMKVAFVAGDYDNLDIYVMNIDGSGRTLLTGSTVGIWDMEPVFSPDGTKIVFSSAPSGSGFRELYVMNTDGTNRTPLTDNQGSNFLPAFSPDGTKIVFSSYRNNDVDIYVMSANGTNQTRLTDNPTFSHYSPAFSPDGTKIVYSAGGSVHYEIFVMNADGSNPINLTNHAGSDASPEFSPGGSKIAFSSDRGGSRQIYVMDWTGSNQTLLTGAAGGSDPAWGAQADSDNDGIGNACEPPYNFTGFFQPIENLPVVNIISAGQAVRINFSLDGDQGLNIFALGYPVSGTVACETDEPASLVDETVNALGNSLSYNGALDQYNYIWKTSKTWKGTCRMLTVKLVDGSVHQAKFRFR